MDYFKTRNLLDRKKKNPANFIFTGIESNETVGIQLFEYSKSHFEEKTDIKIEDIGDIQGTEYKSWLNFHGISQSDMVVSLCKNLNIDDLTIQDILDINQRPKFQEYDDYGFLTIKTTVPGTDDLEVEQISFIFNQSYLVSFQERKADYFEHLRHRLRNNSGIIREKGVDYLLFALLEATIDNYFVTLDDIVNHSQKFNYAQMKVNASPDILEQIERHRMFINFIKNAIQPIKEFLIVNEREPFNFIGKKNQKYFLELKDLCSTLIDNCNSISASLESSANLFFSVQSHKMNQVMKILTIVSTIFIPLTFIAGIYGMNFKFMPELEMRYGYFAVWGLNLLIAFAMILFFRSRKWF